MKYFLSTNNCNLNTELIRFNKSKFITKEELKKYNLGEVVLISIDKPRFKDLFIPFNKKILFRLEYLPVRKFPFDIFFYRLFFDFISEWDSSFIKNSYSFLPFFPPRIGIVHESEIVKENINLNYFFLNQFEKSHLISTLVSNKRKLLWQKKRIELIEFLTNDINQIERYGRGFKEVLDKSEVLINYKYHIAIENCENGPSEKLWDPLLCNCIVFYGGNLDLVYPKIRKAIIQIPIFDKYKSKEIISNELKTSRVFNSITKEDWLEIKSSIKRLYTFENQTIFKG